MANPFSSVESMRRGGDPLSKRTFNIKLTFSALVTAGIVLFIGIAWSFVLGVMVGRGYNPEKKVPQLASLLPDERKAQTAPPNISEQIPKGEVMKPEDLGFMTSLKGKPGEKGVSAPAPAKNVNDPKMRPLSNSMAAVQGGAGTPASQASTQGTTPPPAIQPTASQPAKQPAVPPQPKQNQFDYTWQVATFKDMDSVDKLRARLEGQGLRSRVEKSGKLIKVMVLYRGTEDSAKGVRQSFGEMGLGQPLQRGKKPVGKK